MLTPVLLSTGMDENIKYFDDMISFIVLFAMFYLPSFIGCISNQVIRLVTGQKGKYQVSKIFLNSIVFSIVPTICVMLYHTLNHHTPGSQIWVMVSYATGFFGNEISKKVVSINGLVNFIREMKTACVTIFGSGKENKGNSE